MKEKYMSNLFNIQTAARPLAQREALRFGIAAILLGILFIGITGFAPIDAIHNAAHNTRHSISFPCH
jgi:cobalt transporter subunit CbtB